VIAIPVVAHASIFYRPVSADADEDIFAVIIRIDIPECPARTPVVAHKVVIARPYYPVAYSPVVIYVCVVIVIAVVY
jgi:hypothetical protein